MCGNPLFSTLPSAPGDSLRCRLGLKPPLKLKGPCTILSEKNAGEEPPGLVTALQQGNYQRLKHPLTNHPPPTPTPAPACHPDLRLNSNNHQLFMSLGWRAGQGGLVYRGLGLQYTQVQRWHTICW